MVLDVKDNLSLGGKGCTLLGRLHTLVELKIGTNSAIVVKTDLPSWTAVTLARQLRRLKNFDIGYVLA